MEPDGCDVSSTICFKSDEVSSRDQMTLRKKRRWKDDSRRLLPQVSHPRPSSSCRGDSKRRTTPLLPAYDTRNLRCHSENCCQKNQSILHTPDPTSSVTTTTTIMHTPCCSSSSFSCCSSSTQSKLSMQSQLSSHCRSHSYPSSSPHTSQLIQRQRLSLPSIMRSLLVIVTCILTIIVSPGATQFVSRDINCLQSHNLSSFSHYISKSEVTLCQMQSPYNFNDDLIVEKNSKLILLAGTQVRFAPRKGIIVRGALIVRVSIIFLILYLIPMPLFHF